VNWLKSLFFKDDRERIKKEAIEMIKKDEPGWFFVKIKSIRATGDHNTVNFFHVYHMDTDDLEEVCGITEFLIDRREQGAFLYEAQEIVRSKDEET